MTFRVVITESAREDALAVHEWIARDSVARADAWIDGLVRAIDDLERFPRRFRRAPEEPVFGGEVRQMRYHAHRVIYRVVESEVRILHIRHTARRPMHRPDARTGAQ